MRTILKTTTLAVLAALLFCTQASAQAPLLSYGVNNQIELLQNQAGQRVDFFVSNIAGQGFDSFNLIVQIGDGGAVLGGTDTGPMITAVELGNPGSVFPGGNRPTINPSAQTPLLWSDAVDNVEATGDGLLGTLIFDTTGLAVGTTAPIRFDGISVGGNVLNSFFLDLDDGDNPAIVSSASSGFITIVAVPEPASTVVILAVAGILGVRRRR